MKFFYAYAWKYVYANDTWFIHKIIIGLRSMLHLTPYKIFSMVPFITLKVSNSPIMNIYVKAYELMSYAHVTVNKVYAYETS